MPRVTTRRALVGGLAVAAGTVLGVAGFGLLDGGLRYTDVPVIELPMPATVTEAAAQPPAEADPLAVVPTAAPPLAGSETLAMLASPEPDSGAGPAAPQRPAHSAQDPCDRPCVAAVVTGLGLAREVSARALALPGEVGLSFSPYADALGDWQARARQGGHEVLLDLPLQPLRYPQDDSGPLTVPAAPDGAGRREAKLLEVLATGQGYSALAAEAGAFAAEPGAFAPIARALASRKLGFVELGGSALRQTAEAEALAYAATVDPAADPESPSAAVDRQLARVEAEAEAARAGRALAHVQPTPESLARLAAWIETLPGKGLRLLVPPGGLLDDAQDGAHGGGHAAASR
jgi:polysaccharide deacetylase 2 family uncharacterized protein YibQ